MNNKLELLIDYVRKETGYSGTIDPDEDLLAKEILDSFNIVSLAVFTQEQFGVEFEADELVRENLAHLSKLVELVQKKLAEDPGKA